RALMEEARTGADVPEPSPLFWNHFQSRVLSLVQVEAQSARQSWWSSWADAKALVAMGAMVVVASATLYWNRPAVPLPDTLADGTELSEPIVLTAASLDGDEWEFVTSVMGTLEGDDIHEVLTPSHDAVDAAIDALTSVERERFMRLLKAGMAEGLE
ncbi:MAG: hypothetical protein ABIP90_12270, partial [Vicinamibacterales bacterium]